VRKISPEYRDILLNGYVLSVNQDLARHQAGCLLGCKACTNSSEIQVWGKELYDDEINNYAFGFFNLGDVTASRITYSFPLTNVPLAILCSDLWSQDPSQTVCPGIVGSSEESSSNNDHHQTTTSDWDIKRVHHEDGSVLLEITAVNVPPTAHRMVRVYFRYPTPPGGELVKTLQDEHPQFALDTIELKNL
jgi:hypothetical protein